MIRISPSAGWSCCHMQPAFRCGRAQVRNALQCLRLPGAFRLPFLGCCCTAVSVLEWRGGVAKGSAKLRSINLLLCRCCGGRSVASLRKGHSSRLRRSPPCSAAAARRGRVCVRVHAAALQPGADVPVGGCPAGRRRLGRPHLRHHGPPGIAAHTLRGGRELLRVCRTTHMRARVSRLFDHAHMPEQRLTVPFPGAGAGQSCTGGGSDDARSSMLLSIQMQLRIQMQQRLSAPVGGGHRGVLAATQ